MKPSAYDRERLVHINGLMDDIYEGTSEIYECLVDREFAELKVIIPNLISQLKDIQDSTQDEI